MKLYVGSLAVSYPQGLPNPLGRFDKAFLQQVLPVRKVLEVEMQEVDRIRVPDSDPVVMGRTRVWNDRNREMRLYCADVETPYMLSEFEGDRVIIRYEKEGWKKYGKMFRPWFHIHLEQALLNNDAMVLHSASIIVNGGAIAFTAPSGTGKTTQTNLWHEYAENVEDLNGDRTLLQKTEDGWYACGFPLYGSILRCEQRAAPIRAIVIIRQGKTDQVRELSAVEKTALLYSEITAPSMDPRTVVKTMELIEDLITNTTVIQLNCTMERSAVDVLRSYLENKERG